MRHFLLSLSLLHVLKSSFYRAVLFANVHRGQYIVLASQAHPLPAARGDPPTDPRIPTRLPLLAPVSLADSAARTLVSLVGSRLALLGGKSAPGYGQGGMSGAGYGVASGYGGHPHTSSMQGRRSFGDGPSYGAGNLSSDGIYAPGKAPYSMGRYAGSFGTEGWGTSSARKYE
jgi:hypothetical protein